MHEMADTPGNDPGPDRLRAGRSALSYEREWLRRLESNEDQELQGLPPHRGPSSRLKGQKGQ